MKVEKIKGYWGQIREGLITTVDKFSDEDLGYIPFENGYSVRRIILHIAQEERGEIQYGLTRELDEFPLEFREEEYPELPSMRSLLDAVHTRTLEYIDSLDDQELNNDFEAQWGETKPLIDFILHVIEHEVHHRGELSLILGLLGREGFDA